jgi:hypothetical protein
MSNFAIHLSSSSQPESLASDVFELVGAATINLFDQSTPTFGANRIHLSFMDGLNSQDSGQARVGEFLCVSNSCISDTSVFESVTSIASVDPGLLAHAQPEAIMDNVNIESGVQALSSELLNSIPRLQTALDGGLGYSELSQLILDIQAQVLDLNSVSQNLFGDLSGEVNAAIAELGNQDVSSLLSSMQIDTVVFSDPGLPVWEGSAAMGVTLDGLFTSPETFPLTLDFSNPTGIQEASELFALAGAGSSISSSALGAEADSGFPLSSSGSSDFS